MFIYITQLIFTKCIVVTICFFCTFCCTLAFGYFLNDVTDIKTDLAAGKKNFASTNSRRKNFLILILLLVTAFLPWVFIPKNRFNVSLYFLQLLLLVVYSVPPVRLKKYPLPGIITDSLYNSVVPLWVVGTTFWQYLSFNPGTSFSIVIFTATLWIFLKGIRGILLHQMGDRKNDIRSGIHTFASRYGPYKTLMLVLYILFPLEILFFLLLTAGLSVTVYPFLFVIIPLFVFYLFLFFRIWEKKPGKPKKLSSDILFVINDLYEEWLPVVFLIYLIVLNPVYIVMLLIHIILFYQISIKLSRNFLMNLKNLSDFWDYCKGIPRGCIKS